MKNFRQSVRLAGAAAKANLLPGLLLQIPVAVFIQIFWVLIFTTMEESLRASKVVGVHGFEP